MVLRWREQWRRYPGNNDGQAASRTEQGKRSHECLAGAGYLELCVCGGIA